MSLNSNALIDFAYMQLLYGENSIRVDDQELIEESINMASQECERIMRRKLKAQDITEYHDGQGGRQVSLRQYPVNSISEIISDVYLDFDSDDAYASDEYIVNDIGVVTLKSGCFPYGDKAIKVTYNAGFADEDIPNDVKTACAEIAYAFFRRVRQKDTGVESESFPNGVNFSYETDVPAAAFNKLRRLRMSM